MDLWKWRESADAGHGPGRGAGAGAQRVRWRPPGGPQRPLQGPEAGSQEDPPGRGRGRGPAGPARAGWKWESSPPVARRREKIKMNEGD